MTSTDDRRAQRIADDIVTGQARRRRRTRWAVAASATVVVAVAVPLAIALNRPATDGHPVAGDRTATTPTGGTTPTTATASPKQQRVVPDEAQIYAAVLGARPKPELGRRVKPVYVLDAFCTGMIDIEGGQRGPCTPGPIPADLQREIRAIAGEQVHFTAEPPQPALKSPVIRIGTATLVGDRARVPIDVQCGPLCGQGETMIVVRDGENWTVTGSSGYAWIS